MMRSQLYNYHGSSLLVKGQPAGTSEIRTVGRLSEVDFLDSDDLNLVMEQSEMVVCRSGYSTIMDLARLGKNAILVPTPGQTEQMFLAKILFKKGICYFKDQADFKLAKAMTKTSLYSGFNFMNFENDILEDVIIKVLK